MVAGGEELDNIPLRADNEEEERHGGGGLTKVPWIGHFKDWDQVGKEQEEGFFCGEILSTHFPV